MTRRTTIFATTVILAMVLAMAGCSGGSSITSPADTAAGSWSGNFDDAQIGSTVTLNLTLNGTTGAVTGTAFMGIGSLGFPLTVTKGNYRPPNIYLSLESPTTQPVLLTGQIHGNEMDAVLNGSGFSFQDVTLNR